MGNIRDLALFAIIFGLIPFILRAPHIGVLTWSWLSYMNPHRMTWGAAYDFPFAQVVAVALLLAILFSKEPKYLPKHWLIAVWLVFIAWMGISTLNAYYPEAAQPQFIKIIKIQLIIFITMLIMHSAERIKMMVWVIFLSVGFFGIKGGAFTLLTGGAHRVWGPTGSFIQDNNHLAIALLMVLPLGYYLLRHELTNIWYKRAMWVGLALIALSVVGSFSRGAFLSILCVSFYLWLKTEKKLISAMFVLPLLPIMFMFMPDSWHERMSSIETYKEDASAMGRLNAWAYSINAANDNFTGVGLESWKEETFVRWAPNPENVAAAHSIYFSVLADHGWLGLIMFLVLFLGGFIISRRTVKIASPHERYRWAADLARMIQVSLVAYGTGGAFLSMSYFDLPWHLLAISLLLQQRLKEDGIWVEETRRVKHHLRAPSLNS